VDAGPDRKEIMSRETMQHCLNVLQNTPVQTVDITGGAPEMNPHFRWFVEAISQLGQQILVRSNLTIMTTASKYQQLPSFFARHGVRVISSLPCYTAENTDAQRGTGVFEKSIEALQMLNAEGYGRPESGLELDLVYNPLGAFLPPSQSKLEADYKRMLEKEHGITFNRLLCITNMPINRFLDYLLDSGQFETYMDKLVQAFNPAAVAGLMCRNTLSVGWDGRLYDCDFNQMLELEVGAEGSSHIADFNLERLKSREVVTKLHCFGCTAGAGSSCAGEILT
jgi:radical SAM/Cys-rich protein